MSDPTDRWRGSPDSPGAIVTYTNRHGDVYYLHEGRTKTGKVRYFVAKSVGAGALSAMPGGYEFSESVNAVVSVRRIDPSIARIPPSDLAQAASEVARHPHLRGYIVEDVKGEIVVFEPIGGIDRETIAEISRRFGVAQVGTMPGERRRRVRYRPVMKFVPSRGRTYRVHRMTYRGEGGWSWPLNLGTLPELLDAYVRHIDTDEFYERV